ncbi:MAG TPA: DUF5677 domain-containing protein [Candidatus Nanopelagicaceae bacterium]|nr:DUF5677 domain-containing protein [Candidatus Nanopelagicaceae bacterium]
MPEAVRKVNAEFNRFIDGFFQCQELDLHTPANHEVIAGLVTRAVRSVTANLRVSHLWCGEYGSNLTRLLAETEIVLAWLAKMGSEGYAQFQAYGDGKAKLMRAHMRDLLDDFSGEPPEMLIDSIEHLDKKLGGEWAEEFIPVSVDPTFVAGKSVWTMAQETGREDLYRYVYQSASGVSHGEWWAVQDYAMQRCMNPLHRYHWVSKTTSIISMALLQLEGLGMNIGDSETDLHRE